MKRKLSAKTKSRPIQQKLIVLFAVIMVAATPLALSIPKSLETSEAIQLATISQQHQVTDEQVSAPQPLPTTPPLNPNQQSSATDSPQFGLTQPTPATFGPPSIELKPLQTATPTPTATPLATSTPTPTATPTINAVAQPTTQVEPTATALPPASPTPQLAPAVLPTVTATPTVQTIPTSTPLPTATATPIVSPTAAATETPAAQPEPTATALPTSAPSPTAVVPSQSDIESSANEADPQATPQPKNTNHNITQIGHQRLGMAGVIEVLVPLAQVELIGLHQASHPGARPISVDLGGAPLLTMASRGRGTSLVSAIDMVAPPNTAVRAPVTGKVVAAKEYALYCKYPDNLVYIQPDQAPHYTVKLFHLQNLQVSVGQWVVAGDTLLASGPNPLPFESQIDAMTGSPSWGHVHMEVLDTTIPDTRPGGGGCP